MILLRADLPLARGFIFWLGGLPISSPRRLFRRRWRPACGAKSPHHGVVLGTLALYTLIANRSAVSLRPRAVDPGGTSPRSSSSAAGEQLYHGAGGCTAFHGLGTRAPNLLTDEKGQGPMGRGAAIAAGKDFKAYCYESLATPRGLRRGRHEPILPEMGASMSPRSSGARGFLESTADGGR